MTCRFRLCGIAGAGEIIVTAVNDETGEAVFEPESAQHWQPLMKWPRLPTPAEAEAWQRNADARKESALWLQAVNSGHV
jgi:hypothetical protein